MMQPKSLREVQAKAEPIVVKDSGKGLPDGLLLDASPPRPASTRPPPGLNISFGPPDSIGSQPQPAVLSQQAEQPLAAQTAPQRPTELAEPTIHPNVQPAALREARQPDQFGQRAAQPPADLGPPLDLSGLSFFPEDTLPSDLYPWLWIKCKG